jgi:hypothetical protein
VFAIRNVINDAIAMMPPGQAGDAHQMSVSNFESIRNVKNREKQKNHQNKRREIKHD